MTFVDLRRMVLAETGCDKNTKHLEYFHFCLDERPANELLALVLEGRKRAAASSQ